MFWKYLLLSCFLLRRYIILIEAKASTELRKTYITNPDAVCNDNSKATFYIGPQSIKKWIVFFESGGLCSSREDCNKRFMNSNSTVLMTSKSLPDEVTGRDLLSTVESENPTFHNYTHVLVPYCSSDLWLGARTNPNKGSFEFVNDSSVDNFGFRGHTIFQSVFSDLLKQYNLSRAEEIILVGSSAGAIGVLNHAEWVLNRVIKSYGLNAKLLTILDSSWFIDFQDGFKSRVQPGFAKLTNITSPACADMSYGYSCCLSSSCMFTRSYFPSTVPVLFVFSLYDIYMFADVLKRLEVEGKTAEDHAADFLSVVSMYGGAMNESLVLVENQAVNMSYFVPACFQHVYFSTSSLWDEILHPLVEVTRGTGKFTHRVQSGTWALTKIHSRSLQDFISSWVKSDFTAGSLVDSCIGAHCNPTCPDKLVFIDSGEVWHKTVKAFVIGLSLVITILCFGLKTSFVFYYNFLLKKRRQYLDDSETSQARKELPLTRRDEAISIACLSLTYLVDIKKEKNHKDITEESEEDASITKPDRNSRTSVILGSAMEEDSGSDYQDFDEDGDVDLIGSEVVNGYTCLDIATEGTNSEPTPQEQRGHDSFISSDGCSTWGSNAGSHVAMIQDSKDCSGSVSCLSPRSKDIESVGKESRALKKQILKGVSAYFNTGELVAIMGPSGCGKTTLLDLLTGRRRHGDCKGQVYINGVGLGRLQEWYACKIGYVLQLAVPYYEELTVRQNLFFAAHLRLAKGTRALEKFERVEQIIAETGLTSLAETVVGGSKGLGLSGGQKRRLCVALQMINMPSVLFLDEPTSGLDATSSLELLNHLNLVAESGRLVILTIHQPRLEIFHLFHKILLLCDGQVAYYGEPSMAPELFLKAYAQATTEEFRLSDKAPKIDAKNPADTIMDLLNCSQARWAILDYYQTSGEPQAVQEAITTAQQKASETLTLSRMEKISRADGAGSFNRIFVLESRAAEKQTLGQILYFPVIFFMFGIIVGTVYWQAEERDGILLMSAYCVYCCASPLFLSSVLMAHLNKALNIFHLEREDGCGRSHENVIQTFVRTTAVCVIPVVVCSTMSYFMVMTSYDVWKFFFVTIISLVLNQTWIAVYMMVICAQPQIAHRICPMVSAIGGFAGGFLVPRPQMPVGYNLLFYINPQFYGYSAITKVLLLNVRLKCEYESTLNCISTDGNAVLSRFGFDKVNPYEHLMIMLGMTVVSLILSWVFLEVKYLNLRQFTRTAPALSAVEAPADDVEVPVEPVHETPAKKIEDEVSEDEFAEIPEGFPLKPFTRNRRSAKSRLGLISKDQGFHTVKIPAQRKRTATAESMFYASQTMTGGEDVEDEARPRSRRLTSATKRELWKSTKQHQKERKISFNMHMTQVQHLARRFSVHHSQSVRRRARKTGASIPRRSTMATTELTDVKRQQFAARKCVVSISDDDCKLDLFSEEVEESPNGNTGEELETSAHSQDQLKKDEYNEQTGDICEDLTDGGRATVAEESKRSSGGLIMKHPKDEQKQSKDGCTSGISPELAEKDNGKMERDLPSQNTAEQSVFVSSDLEHSTSQEMEHSTGVLKEDQAERSFCEIINNVLEQGSDNEPLPVSNDSTSQGITLQQTEEQTEKKEEPKRRVSTVAFSDLTDIVDV